MVVDVLKSNKITKMFQAMVVIRLKMGNLGLKVQSLKTRLTIMEGEKQVVLKQMQKEHESHEEYKKWMGGWKKHKIEMEEKLNAKMLELITRRKELKRRMVEWTTLQKECHELKNK